MNTMPEMSARKKRKIDHNSYEGEVVQFSNKFLVRFGPFLHLFVTRNGVIRHKGCVAHRLFETNSLTQFVKQLRDNIFIEDLVYCIGSTCLAPLSAGLKYRTRCRKRSKVDEEIKGFLITDGVLKSNRIDKRKFDPRFDYLIETNESPIVVIDSDGEAYKTDKKGYVVVKDFSRKCETVIVDLSDDKKAITVSTIDECEPIKRTITLGLSGLKRKLKGHLMMMSAVEYGSEPFQVLFVGDGGFRPVKEKSSETSPSSVKPVLFCELNDYSLVQLGAKVYLLGEKRTDSRPVALMNVWSNARHSSSILHIKDLVRDNCGEVENELVIGKRRKSVKNCNNKSESLTQKSNSSAVLTYDNKKFSLSIRELFVVSDTVLRFSSSDPKPDSICFGKISRVSSMVSISTDGRAVDFVVKSKNKDIVNYIERIQMTRESDSSIGLKTRLLQTNRRHDSTRYPVAVDLRRHTISLNKSAALFIREADNKGVVKVERKGFAIVGGYLVVIAGDDGVVCDPNAAKLVLLRSGRHLLQCGKSGHILFVSDSNSLVIFDQFNTQEDPLIRYFKRSYRRNFDDCNTL